MALYKAENVGFLLGNWLVRVSSLDYFLTVFFAKNPPGENLCIKSLHGSNELCGRSNGRVWHGKRDTAMRCCLI